MCLPQDRLPDHQEVLVEQPDLAQVATSLVPHQAVHPEEHQAGRRAVHRVIPPVVRRTILQVHLHQAVVRPAIHQVVPQVTLLADRHQVLLPVVQIAHQAAPILLVADQAQAPVAAQDVHQHRVVHLPEDHPAVADNKKSLFD